MVKLPPIPTTIPVYLRSSDRTLACLDIDSCQLEVIENDHQDMIVVEDTDIADHKLVRVGIVREGGGCDYLVRIGLVAGRGPVACGVAGTARWEVKLWSCRPPENLFLSANPAQLISIRHMAQGVFAVVTCIQETTGSWRVIVERRGSKISIFRISFGAASDSLYVSAALSRDLMTLYVVESRSISGIVTATYHIYSYNRFSNEWAETATGTIPDEGDIAATRNYHVDRDGGVAGNYYRTSHSEFQQDVDGLSCLSQGVGHNYYRQYDVFDDLYCGTYSLISHAYQPGVGQRLGMTVHRGELQPVHRDHTEGVRSRQAIVLEDWAQTMTENFHYINWQKNNPYVQELRIGSVDIGKNHPVGTVDIFSAKMDGVYTVYGETLELYHYTYHTAVDDYYYFSGSELSSVTAGGLILTTKNGTERTLNVWSRSGSDDGNVNDWFGNCQNYSDWAYAEEHYSESSIESFAIVHPVVLDVVSCTNTFMSFDEESGDLYAGALVVLTPGADPVWRVWKNGGDYLPFLTSCLADHGHSLDEFLAIYWRA